MPLFRLVSALGLLLSSVAAFAGSPIVIEPSPTQKGHARPPTAGLLLERHGVKVHRAVDAKDGDFRDLYLVHLQPGDDGYFLGRYQRPLHIAPGNFAIMRLGEDQVGRLSGDLHHRGMACGAVMKLNGDLTAESAIVDPVPTIPVSDKLKTLGDILSQVSADRIKATVVELSGWDTRRHDSAIGKTVADNIAAMYQAFVEGRQDVTIETFAHGGATPQPSLVVRIAGKTRPDEIVVLGSHIDSINGQGRASPAPGADDNASGTATNLEVFRVLMANHIELDRTLEIHGYAAEEIGLVGSQDMAAKYKRAGKQVIAMVQHDMSLYNESDRDEIWLVSNNTNAKLNDDLAILIGQYIGLPVQRAPLYAGSSDHASWTRAGFAAAFPFENPSRYNRAIHTHRDTIATASRFTQSAAFGKLAVAYAAHFAGWQAGVR